MLSENATIDQDVDEDCSLNIFEMIESTNEPTKEFVNKELLIFKRFEVDLKISNVLFNDERSMNLCLLHVDSLLVRS
jgi:hypothetical protein